VSIRLQLLIVALTTLILPWAGCQYARELEDALRASQENALESTADTIALALSAQPARVFRAAGDPRPYVEEQGDLYVFALRSAPLLDGYREDWGVAADPKRLPSANGYGARLQVGSTDRYLFLYIEVDDPHFAPEPANPDLEKDRFDRVDVTMEQPDGSLESYFFATGAPGLIEAQRTVIQSDGTAHVATEPRIQAYWLETAGGYHLEARVPLALVGSRLWIEAREASGRKAGFTADSADGGRLFMATSGLGELLGTFIRPGTRVTVIDTNGLKLGTAGSPGAAGMLGSAGLEEAPGGSWYRRFVTVDTSSWPLQTTLPDRMAGKSVAAALAGRPAAEWLRTNAGAEDLMLLAAAPIVVESRTRGAVVLEQSGDQLLDLRDRALAHLFNLTLLATALAVLFAFTLATFISVRIGRLRSAADSAIGNDGRIRLEMPESASADEIGALARAFERLLARLNEHARYLRTLGGKLSHELRTPLTIVRSSLDNLESEGVRGDQRGYLTRAREGTVRLQSILAALGAASRVEESIQQAERVSFDLAELLRAAIAGYRDAFPEARFVLEAPADGCLLRGAPELIAQMLDKLVENAVDFTPAGGAITVRLVRAGSNYELSVENDGPSIPDAMLGRLFESLFEHRPGSDDKPHFGLGLYIVRLIAEFHDGRALAANRSAGGGAMFTVILPLI
jgi:two-component system, OmpR family, sensor histidine kinase ChvG